MASGSQNERGVTKWRMPSAGQAAVIIFIFAVPIIISVLFLEKIPQLLRVPLFAVWFISAFIFYIYIISHGKGKEKSTITSTTGLNGEFTIDNNWISWMAFYPLAATAGSLINGYYIIAGLLFMTSLFIFAAGKYYRKKIRIDDTGNFYFIQKGEEMQIELSTVKSVEARLNPMRAEAIYKPIIIINFNNSITENKPIRLKFSVLRSVKYGTYTPARLILSYMQEKCISNGFKITYLNHEETDFIAEKF